MHYEAASAEPRLAGETSVTTTPEPVESSRPATRAPSPTKGIETLSSEMDLASEHTVRELLQTRTPDIPLLGEEEGGPDPSTGRCWVLDPINGTVNYLHQLTTYAIALSLIENGQTVLAATHLPATRTTYSATAGGGAHADGRQLTASITKDLADALVAIDQFTFVDDDPDQVNALRQNLIKHLTPTVHRISR